MTIVAYGFARDGTQKETIPAFGYGIGQLLEVIPPGDLEDSFLRTAETNYLVDVQVISVDQRLVRDLVLNATTTNFVKALTTDGLIAVDRVELIRPLQDGVVRIQLATPQRVRTLDES